MKKLLTLAATAVLALAGCGSTTTHVVTHRVVVPAPVSVAAHSCDRNSDSYFMQCALLNQAPTLGALPLTVPSTKGIDFAWSCPSPAGWDFGASYLSPDTSKNWTNSCVNRWHAAGAKTVAVWEGSGTRALGSFSDGVSDAQRAEQQALALGMPASRPIDFAIDFDANGPDVQAYFQGVHSVLGNRGNAYGGFRPLLWLHQHGLVGNTNWQTYAWSGGAWLPASIAPLEQFLNSSAVDYDRAIAADYGQWPYNAQPPGPTPAQIKHWQQARNSSFNVYHNRGCTSSLDKTHGCSVLAQRVVYFQNKLWTVYPRWNCFGPHARVRSAVCWIVRPQANTWTHAKLASQHAFQSHVCGGATGTQALTQDCRIWKQRANWFGSHATALVNEYS